MNYNKLYSNYKDNPHNIYMGHIRYPYYYIVDKPEYKSIIQRQHTTYSDFGPNPFVININEATKHNDAFRTALWTGNNLQLTLMSIDVGENIGLEVHPNLDQFIRIEEGLGIVKMGDSKDNLNFHRPIYDDIVIIIPAGSWHDIINTGNKPLKLYSIYAPPQHPYGTVHKTKEIAELNE